MEWMRETTKRIYCAFGKFQCNCGKRCGFSSVTVEKVLTRINELKAFPLPFTVKTEIDRSTKFPLKRDVFLVFQ
jgi:hypothetical protein